MIIKAFKAARRAVGRVVTKEIEDIKNARSWREFIRSAQRHRYRKFARPHPTAMMTVFEPVHLLVFNEMIEMHGGKLKAERMIYIAPDKIESVQPYSKHVLRSVQDRSDRQSSRRQVRASASRVQRVHDL
jgi:hypothetical protein